MSLSWEFYYYYLQLCLEELAKLASGPHTQTFKTTTAQLALWH
jgi:hypothetical protein